MTKQLGISSIKNELSLGDWRILGRVFNSSENAPYNFEKRESLFVFMESKDLRQHLFDLLAKYNARWITLYETVHSHKKFKKIHSRLARTGKKIENCWLEIVYRQKVDKWLCHFDILTRTGRLNRDTILQIIGEKPR